MPSLALGRGTTRRACAGRIESAACRRTHDFRCELHAVYLGIWQAQIGDGAGAECFDENADARLRRSESHVATLVAQSFKVCDQFYANEEATWRSEF